MAQPGVAEGNGVAEPQNLEQPATTPQTGDESASVGAKRKREDDDEDERADGVADGDKDTPVNGIMEGATRPNEKDLIRAVYDVLKEYVDSEPSRASTGLYPTLIPKLKLILAAPDLIAPLSSRSRYHHRNVPSLRRNAQSPKNRHKHPQPSRKKLRVTSTRASTSLPTIYQLLSGRDWLRPRRVPAPRKRKRSGVFGTKPLSLSRTSCHILRRLTQPATGRV